MNNPAPLIDHTLLRPDLVQAQVASLCEEAVEYGFASVCIPPVWVDFAADLLYGSGVKVCSVVGFPCGYQTSSQKALEAAELIGLGAEEIDMVAQIGALKDGDEKRVSEDILQVVRAAQDIPVKVILETCFLAENQVRQGTRLVMAAGAAFVKTSTGFGPAGARVEDVRVMAEVAAGKLGIKAAGGIRDLASCATMLNAGATRIGSSSGVEIVRQWQVGGGAGCFSGSS